MSTRLFDVFAVQHGVAPTGATPAQLVGPGELTINSGFRRVVGNTDGAPGPAAHDKGAFFLAASLGLTDVTSFMAVLAAFEGVAGGQRAILAEAKEVGAATVTDILLKHMRLIGASLNIQQDRYADVRYDLQASCDAASDSQDDEVSYAEAQVKTATIGSGKRAYRVTAVTHNAIAAGLCTGFGLDVRGQPVADAADGAYGETVEVGAYEVGGQVAIRDFDVTTLESKGQSLIDAAAANLVVALRQQGGSDSTTLTLANCQFFDMSDVFRGKDYAACTLKYFCEFVSGTTPYALASGTNKIITMA